MSRSLHGDTHAVANAFLRREKEKSGAMRSDGQAIYSYDWRLAHWDHDWLVLDRPALVAGYARYSATTDKHARGLRYALLAMGYPMPTEEYVGSDHKEGRFIYRPEDRVA